MILTRSGPHSFPQTSRTEDCGRKAFPLTEALNRIGQALHDLLRGFLLDVAPSRNRWNNRRRTARDREKEPQTLGRLSASGFDPSPDEPDWPPVPRRSLFSECVRPARACHLAATTQRRERHLPWDPETEDCLTDAPATAATQHAGPLKAG